MSSRTFAKFASFSMMSSDAVARLDAVAIVVEPVGRGSDRATIGRRRPRRRRGRRRRRCVASASARRRRSDALARALRARVAGARARRRRAAPRSRRRVSPPRAHPPSAVELDVLRGQEERERAALPGVLSTRISPPSRRAISRLIESPSPVPPNLRLVVPSACWNASKMSCCLSFGMPMPVSLHRERDHASSALVERCGWRSASPFSALRIVSVTPPCSVNLNAFESRFLSTCCSRWPSV